MLLFLYTQIRGNFKYAGSLKRKEEGMLREEGKQRMRSKQRNRSLSGKRRKSAFCQTVAGKLVAASGKGCDKSERWGVGDRERRGRRWRTKEKKKRRGDGWSVWGRWKEREREQLPKKKVRKFGVTLGHAVI